MCKIKSNNKMNNGIIIKNNVKRNNKRKYEMNKIK